ncbi:site-specific integrase [Radiobacillus sp. PE A8.2]|uniref:site-specific integrase n=1 Tax=Radiobacillus sp. PE A8.2 TaxID=3380349 RepID=UPI00388F6975
MNVVQPIRDKQVLEEIEHYLKQKNKRDYIMFILGIYTGLRISDILNLKAKDLRDKTYLTLKEQKTKKRKTNTRKTIKINPFLKRELKEYLSELDDEVYVIKSRVGFNKPISRERAYKILQEVANKFRLEHVGTHTLRKTFGYHIYKATKDPALLQKLFNHSSEEITLRYIGINQDTMDDAISKLKYH